jgi:hypothetical protein
MADKSTDSKSKQKLTNLQKILKAYNKKDLAETQKITDKFISDNKTSSLQPPINSLSSVSSASNSNPTESLMGNTISKTSKATASSSSIEKIANISKINSTSVVTSLLIHPISGKLNLIILVIPMISSLTLH